MITGPDLNCLTLMVYLIFSPEKLEFEKNQQMTNDPVGRIIMIISLIKCPLSIMPIFMPVYMGQLHIFTDPG